MRLRSFHRILGLMLFVFLLSAAISGVMRANAKFLYWKDRPALVKANALSQPQLSMAEVFDISKSHFLQIKRVELKPFLDSQVYQVDGEGGKLQSLLINAASGEVLSPLTEEQAKTIAQAYVPQGTAVIQLQSIPAYKMRKSNAVRPVYRILLDDSAKSEIYVDQENGNTLNLLDRGRRFGMWMVRLHELEFPGLGHKALTITGTGVVILCITGLGLAVSGLKFKKREKSYL